MPTIVTMYILPVAVMSLALIASCQAPSLRPAATQPASSAPAARPAATEPAETAVASRPVDLDPRQTALEILAVYRNAAQHKARLRNVHIVSSRQEYAWIESLGQWVETPERVNVWGWYERLDSAGRTRLDLDPEMLADVGSSRPYRESRYLVVFDKQTVSRITFTCADGICRANMPERRSDLVPFWETSINGLDLLPTGQEAEYLPLESWQSPERFGGNEISSFWAMTNKYPHCVKARTVTDQNRPLIELTIIPETPRGYVHRAVLDPSRGYMFKSLVTAMSGQVISRLDVADVRQIGPELWLPVAWTREDLHEQRRYQTTRAEFFNDRQADAIFEARDVRPGAAMLTLPHGPGEPGKPADLKKARTAPAAAPHSAPPSSSVQAPSTVPPLGPVTLWVPDEGEPFIDLDTARTMELQEFLVESRTVDGWLAGQGIDLIWQQDRLGDSLVFIDAAMQVVDRDDWDRATAPMIYKAMSRAAPARRYQAVPLGGQQVPATFLVRTREGGMGILNVRKARDSAAAGGVEVQYRILEQPDVVGPAGLSADSREALLRQLQLGVARTEAGLLRLRAQTDAEDPRIATIESQLEILRGRIQALEAAGQASDDGASRLAAASQGAASSSPAREQPAQSSATGPAAAAGDLASRPGAAQTTETAPDRLGRPDATRPATIGPSRAAARPPARAAAPQAMPAAAPQTMRAAAEGPNLVFADFPSRFADGNCLQGLPRPVILRGQDRPAFCKSGSPLLFDMHHTPMPTRLLLDESDRTGRGYDTLYVDFDDDGDFTDNVAYKAVPFAGTMFPYAAPVVLYFRDVHLPRNLRQGTSTHVQIYIEQLPGWPEDLTSLHPRIIPQRWAVGAVAIEGKRVPAAVIDRGWDESFVDQRGLDPADPSRFPRGDYMVLGLDGESELVPCDLDENRGSARLVLTEYAAIDGRVYQVRAEKRADGVQLELVPAEVPMGTLRLDAEPRVGRLVLIGTRTCAVVQRPGREIRVPADTYVAPAMGKGVLVVEPGEIQPSERVR